MVGIICSADESKTVLGWEDTAFGLALTLAPGPGRGRMDGPYLQAVEQQPPAPPGVGLNPPPRPQLHRADPDGDGPVQAAEDPASEQRPYLLLPLPDPERAQIHPLG